jgi:hypothetical protein
MPNDQAKSTTPAPASPDPVSAADAKRRAARRRFLARGSAGSGMVIVTLYHQRAFGTYTTDRTILASSPEACHSLGGKAGYKKWTESSVTPKKYVERYTCDVPYTTSTKNDWWKW